ncbi:hypothetical protein [Bosea sp. 685]|uniref:hypothetical protein n=1 Tax=Bosea sp. 685 TaxID=3080057 RepID=UPI0028936A44|nr:hypothetical protein [Bosea sp. 685]WNJ89949.1 hypothetical protein RMR04_26745 [Bosea sp. 685]
MFKTTLTLAALGFALALSPVQAQTTMPATPAAPVTCTQAELTKLDTDASKLTDATKKTAATKEMTMAKEMMAKKDMKGCTTHMDNAMKMMPSKS